MDVSVENAASVALDSSCSSNRWKSCPSFDGQLELVAQSTTGQEQPSTDIPNTPLITWIDSASPLPEFDQSHPITPMSFPVLPSSSSNEQQTFTVPVEVNVGGEIFVVGPGSVSKSSFLSSAFQQTDAPSHNLLKDGNGRLFVDRDPLEFRDLLEFLRTGELSLPVGSTPNSLLLRRIRKSFSFYGVGLPPLCVRCHSLYDPALNNSSACLSHQGVLVSSSLGVSTLSCCNQPPESLGCVVTCHSDVFHQAPINGLQESATIPHRTRQTKSSVSDATKSSIWRVKPEEGKRVPLVVDLGIATTNACPGVKLESTDGTVVPRSLIFSRSTTTPLGNLSPSRNTGLQPSNKIDSSFNGNSKPPFDLVCRAEECPSEKNLEFVNLCCDVDIESMDFRCQTGECSLRVPCLRKVPEVKSVLSESCCTPIFPRSHSLTPMQRHPVSPNPADNKLSLRGSAERYNSPMLSNSTRTQSLDTSFCSDLDGPFVEPADKPGPCWLHLIQQANRRETPVCDEVPVEQTKEKLRCEHFKEDKCQRGGRCQFLHEVAPSRNASEASAGNASANPKSKPTKKLALVGVRTRTAGNPRYKTRMCPLFRAGACSRPASDCKFAHGLEELRGTSEFFKTQICSFWSAGFCRAGVRCRHAHGERDLRREGSEADQLTNSKSQKTKTDSKETERIVFPVSSPRGAIRAPQPTYPVAMSSAVPVVQSGDAYPPYNSIQAVQGQPTGAPSNYRIMWLQMGRQPTPYKTPVPFLFPSERYDWSSNETTEQAG